MKYTAKPLPPVELPELRQVGKPLRRVDALGKAVGTTVYGADYSVPNMSHANVFCSSEPSARIKPMDVSKARALPGVVCASTGADVTGAKPTTDMPGQTGREARAGSDAPVLASDVVRFVGEPIALVAAETLTIAEQALKLIDIEYEPLPGVFDPPEAMKPGAPVIFELDNVVARWKIRRGDLEAGFASANVIVENTYRVPFVEHAFLELEPGVAWVDEQGVINICVGTQVIKHFRNIARAVGVPQNKIRARDTLVGGGFGGKEDITVEIFLALLAKHTQRPVKLVYTREESFIAQPKRHPFIITHRTGAKKNGRITAAEINMIADPGAYPYLSPYVLLHATIMASGPYRIDNLRIAVLDERPDMVTPEQFPQSELRLTGDLFQQVAEFPITEHTFVVMVTPHHTLGEKILAALKGRPVAYVGLIGSRRRTAHTFQRARESGVPQELFERVHTPIGLDIGAETPLEIAISIIAEIIAAQRGRA